MHYCSITERRPQEAFIQLHMKRKNPSKAQQAKRTDSYFLTRAGRADLDEAKKILKRAGRNKPPVPGDEI